MKKFVPEVSPMEYQMWQFMIEYQPLRQLRSLPTPQLKVGSFYLDFGWEKYKIGFEYDGRIHATRWHKDYQREMWFKAKGWEIYKIFKPGIFYQWRKFERSFGAYRSFDDIMDAVLKPIVGSFHKPADSEFMPISKALTEWFDRRTQGA
jgi:very-short-patch-repair endonuclease